MIVNAQVTYGSGQRREFVIDDSLPTGERARRIANDGKDPSEKTHITTVDGLPAYNRSRDRG